MAQAPCWVAEEVDSRLVLVRVEPARERREFVHLEQDRGSEKKVELAFRISVLLPKWQDKRLARHLESVIRNWNSPASVDSELRI